MRHPGISCQPGATLCSSRAHPGQVWTQPQLLIDPIHRHLLPGWCLGLLQCGGKAWGCSWPLDMGPRAQLRGPGPWEGGTQWGGGIAAQRVLPLVSVSSSVMWGGLSPT